MATNLASAEMQGQQQSARETGAVAILVASQICFEARICKMLATGCDDIAATNSGSVSRMILADTLPSGRVQCTIRDSVNFRSAYTHLLAQGGCDWRQNI